MPGCKPCAGSGAVRVPLRASLDYTAGGDAIPHNLPKREYKAVCAACRGTGTQPDAPPAGATREGSPA